MFYGLGPALFGFTVKKTWLGLGKAPQFTLPHAETVVE